MIEKGIVRMIATTKCDQTKTDIFDVLSASEKKWNHSFSEGSFNVLNCIISICNFVRLPKNKVVYFRTGLIAMVVFNGKMVERVVLDDADIERLRMAKFQAELERQ